MLEPEVIDQISKLVEEHGLDEAAVTSLRSKWPDIHLPIVPMTTY